MTKELIICIALGVCIIILEVRCNTLEDKLKGLLLSIGKLIECSRLQSEVTESLLNRIKEVENGLGRSDKLPPN